MTTVSSTLRPHIVRSAAFLLPVAVSLVVLSIGMGFSILTGLRVVGGSGAGGLDLGPEAASGLTLIGLAGTSVFGIVWILSLFVSVREVVGEGSVVIASSSGSAADARDAVRARLEEHGTELVLGSGDLDGHPTLRVHDGDGTHALVLVRPAGRDLRVSWTSWRNRSTSTLIIDQFSGRRGQDIALLDSDAAVALGVSVHDALGEVVLEYGQT
jgi:hypothetical protein